MSNLGKYRIYPADYPRRETKIISASFYRTGSLSLAQALKILGYRDIFHTFLLNKPLPGCRPWAAVGQALVDNCPCLPAYTGNRYTKADWEELLGPCEVITDLPQLSPALIEAYPDAKVILVHRDFESWSPSFERLISRPLSFVGRLSFAVFEPLAGFKFSIIFRDMARSVINVPDVNQVLDRAKQRRAYDEHYAMIRRMVPPERLLECNMGDGWDPICEFLGKEVPDQPYPRANEGSTISDAHTKAYSIFYLAGTLKVAAMGVLGCGGYWLGKWLSARGLVIPLEILRRLLGTDEAVMKTVAGGGFLSIGGLWLFSGPTLSTPAHKAGTHPEKSRA